MLSSALVASLVGLSALAWFYNRFMRTTGGNSRRAITGAALLAGLTFFAVLFALYFIDKSLSS